MTQHDDVLYLGHMRDMCETIVRMATAKSRVEFNADEVLQFALVRALTVIGEASRHVSLEGRNALPEIDWSTIGGMRNRLVHDYFNINLTIVWDTVTNDIPVLLEVLESVIPPNPPD